MYGLHIDEELLRADGVTQPIPNLDSTSVDYWLTLADANLSEDTLSDEERTMVLNSMVMASKGPEALIPLCQRRLQRSDAEYLRAGEALYFLQMALKRDQPDNYTEAFKECVRSNLNIGYDAAIHRIRTYRNVYQRLHDEMPNHEHRKQALNTIAKFSAEMMRELASNQNAERWEFRDGKVVLKNCVDAGTEVSLDTKMDDLKKSLHQVKNDPDPEIHEEIPPIEGVQVRLLECTPIFQRIFFIRRSDGTVTHYHLLNASLILLQGDEPTIEPDEYALLSSYMRYDECPDGILTSERNRQCFVYDRHRACWVGQIMEDATL